MERHVPWDSAKQSLSIQRWKDNAGGATNSLTLRKPALLTETPFRTARKHTITCKYLLN